MNKNVERALHFKWCLISVHVVAPQYQVDGAKTILRGVLVMLLASYNQLLVAGLYLLEEFISLGPHLSNVDGKVGWVLQETGEALGQLL